MVSRSTLSAPQSRFRTANYYRRIVSPGRALTCSKLIKKGQGIVAFNGQVINKTAHESLPFSHAQYTLRLFEANDPPDTPYFNQYLDCYNNSQTIPPKCMGCMANSADGLYDRGPDVSLTDADNNADTTILNTSEARKVGVRTIGSQPSLVLYALRDIQPFEEIMWDYDGLEVPDDPQEGGDEPLLTQGEQYFQSAIAEILQKSTGIDQHPSYATTTSGASAAQPKNNDNSDRSTHVLLENNHVNPFDPNYVIWDCASGSHLCKNRDLATNIRACKPASVLGIVEGSEGTYAESCEFLHSSLGRAPLATYAIANILSQACALDCGFGVRYDHHGDKYIVTHPTDHKVKYEFGRVIGARGLSKHYIMDSSTLMPPLTTNSHSYTLMGDCVGVDTVEQRAMRYTKGQVAAADEAVKFVKCMGHPTEQHCINMVERMVNPPVNKADIRRAFDIYGSSLASVRGRTTKTTTTKAEVAESIETPVQTDQVAEVDLMFIRSEAFLLCILSPLEFSFVVPLNTKKTPDVMNALEGIIAATKARGFTISKLRVDNEPAIASPDITNMLGNHGIVVDTVASGDHAAKAERRIRFVKEKWRTLVHTLPYVPSKPIVRWGAIAANRLVNMQRASSSLSPESPREKFLGRLTDYKRDVAGVAFGSYVQAPVPNPNNTDAPRTEACIALVPKDNETGTFYVLKLKTSKAVSRSHLKPMPITDQLRDHLDREALKDGYSARDTYVDEDANEGEDTQTRVRVEGPPDSKYQSFRVDDRDASLPSKVDTIFSRDILQETCKDPPNGEHVRVKQEGEHNDVPIIKLHTQTINEDKHAEPASDDSTEAIIRMDSPRKTPPIKHAITKVATDVRRSPRIAYNEEYPYFHPAPLSDDDDESSSSHILMTPCEYVHVFATTAGNMSCQVAISKHGDAAMTSIKEEMFQFVERGAFRPVRWTELSADQKKRVIPSMMFIKEKHTPEGTFERIKARLVARGDKQDRSLYTEDVSASTASSMSVFAVIALAAHEERIAVVADIPGAFLHAPMKDDGEEVFLKIEPVLAKMLADKYPEMFKEYVNDRHGDLLVKLLRAVYGTIEAARLWLDDLTATLTKHGYIANPYDPCVFNTIDDKGNQCTICLYVDDLFITCKRQETIDEVLGHLESRYGGVKISRGIILHYLGMIIDLTDKGSAKITMDGMVNSIISDHLDSGPSKVTKTPANDELFKIDAASPLLPESQREVFHTAVARMLYVSKRVRPECLITVGFLVTRVTKATQEDQRKLQRLLRYVSQSHATNHKGIILSIGSNGVYACGWIDAAHGVHQDFKSHTGCAVGIGLRALVHYHSSKQSIITKSSTEAELVGATDGSNQVIHLRSFLIAQGYEDRPAVLYQDNMSAIALIKRGKSGSMRTRHIDIRYFWLTEKCDEGVVTIQYMPTEQMGAANILTKAVLGGQFVVERQAITNWATSEFM